MTQLNINEYAESQITYCWNETLGEKQAIRININRKSNTPLLRTLGGKHHNN